MIISLTAFEIHNDKYIDKVHSKQLIWFHLIAFIPLFPWVLKKQNGGPTETVFISDKLKTQYSKPKTSQTQIHTPSAAMSSKSLRIAFNQFKMRIHLHKLQIKSRIA